MDLFVLFRSKVSELLTYTSQVTKLKKFKPELRFADMSIDFLKQYDVYMISTLKNKTNTHYKSMGFIKTVWFQAMKDGLVTENIFKNFPLKKKQGNRSFLDIYEGQCGFMRIDLL